MSDNFYLCDYVVAFIDLLGQKSAMPSRHLTALTDEAIREIKGSVGRIVGTQESFERFYEGFSSHPTLFDSLPEKLQVQLSDMAPGELKWQPFSDGMVVYIPLGEGMTPSPVNSIFALLCASGMLCLTGLAAKSPLRIGIDVAWAIEYRPGELYGSALAHAYELESRIAKWPRVVIGQGLLDYLSHYISENDGTLSARYRAVMATQCLTFLSRDEEQQEFLDYVGKSFAQITTGPQVASVCKAAWEFANSQQEEWSERGNQILSLRYQKLVAYLQSRGLG